MTAKAYCGRVITEWLASVLGSAVLGPLRDNEEVRWNAVTMTLAIFFGVRICDRLVPQTCKLICLFDIINLETFSINFVVRNALARFFGLLERFGRYLLLDKLLRRN